MKKIIAYGAAVLSAVLFLGTGLGSSPVFADSSTSTKAEIIEDISTISSSKEKNAVEKARKKVEAQKGDTRIIATSPAAIEICNRMDIDLVGVTKSTTTELPKRYANLPTVGTPMSPDVEALASLSPDWILSPQSLQSDLQPKYEAIDTDWAFLNLNSVEGMYRSIYEMGQIFAREEQASQLIEEYAEFLESYQKENKGKKKPKVMILMGLPGSYIIATEKSYVGSLVKMAGGENVYPDEEEAFLTINTEDMKTKDPDIILRAAHALPDQVIEMFDKDFEENDIWKHFDAVKEGKVYDLTYENFGMSANFNYQAALEELQPELYAETDEEIAEAKENSQKARSQAEESDASETYEEIQK